MVNSGLAGELRPDAGEHEIERIGYFQARLATIPLPQPKPGVTIEDAWSGWLPLLNGAGLSPDDPRALIVRRDLGDGRIWGTTSISLVALTPDGHPVRLHRPSRRSGGLVPGTAGARLGSDRVRA